MKLSAIMALAFLTAIASPPITLPISSDTAQTVEIADAASLWRPNGPGPKVLLVAA